MMKMLKLQTTNSPENCGYRQTQKNGCENFTESCFGEN